MVPPTSVCNPAPIVPKMDRERTTIPRTTPSVRVTRKPSSSNCVVTMLFDTILPGLVPVASDVVPFCDASNYIALGGQYAHVGTAALGCPVERSSTVADPNHVRS